MTPETLTDARGPEPLHTDSHMFDDWLTVQETVAYCLSKGLNRTPKTVRKWVT